MFYLVYCEPETTNYRRVRLTHTEQISPDWLETESESESVCLTVYVCVWLTNGGGQKVNPWWVDKNIKPVAVRYEQTLEWENSL